MSTKLAVRVQASARENEIVALRDGVLIVRLTAPAIEGRANKSLSRLLAKRVGVPRSSVSILRGQRSRDKVIQIEGIDHPDLLEALAREG